MVLKAKSLPLEPDNPSVIAGIQGSKRTESWKLSSDIHICGLPHTHTNNKIRELKAELTGESQLVEHLPWPVPKITKKETLRVFEKRHEKS